MLDINFIRENQELIKKTASDKNIDLDLSKLLKLDDQRRALLQKVEKINADKNKASKMIAELKGEEKQKQIDEIKKIGDQEKKLKDKLEKTMSEYNRLMLKVPQITHKSVPIGPDDSGNIEIKKWGEIPKFDFQPLDHIQLGKKLDIIDFQRAVKIAGSRSYIMKGDGARLEQALLRAAMDFISEKGFTLMTVPVLANYEYLMGTGFLPGSEEEIYYLEKDDKYLVGTSEVSLVSYHANEILDEKELPVKMAGYSTCFRREAGSYGKDTKGLYRVHQFQKVEQIILCKNSVEESMEMHKLMLGVTEEFIQNLELPYRLVNACTGDMGQGKYIMFDLETWMPSRNAYGETHSCSALLDFQARRLNLRYKDKNGQTQFCHTLNNTVAATPRILIAIMEINQTKDGKIRIPEILRPYMNNQKVIE